MLDESMEEYFTKKQFFLQNYPRFRTEGEEDKVIEFRKRTPSPNYPATGWSIFYFFYFFFFLCLGFSRFFFVPVSLFFLRVFLNYRSIFPLLHDSLYLPHRR